VAARAQRHSRMMSGNCFSSVVQTFRLETEFKH
jgi:hypothetical protein